MLMHLALDRAYRGHPVTAGPVVYCALEGAPGFMRRIEAFRREKFAKDAGADPPFFLMAAPLNLVADREAFLGRYARNSTA